MDGTSNKYSAALIRSAGYGAPYGRTIRRKILGKFILLGTALVFLVFARTEKLEAAPKTICKRVTVTCISNNEAVCRRSFKRASRRPMTKLCPTGSRRSYKIEQLGPFYIKKTTFFKHVSKRLASNWKVCVTCIVR